MEWKEIETAARIWNLFYWLSLAPEERGEEYTEGLKQYIVKQN